MRQLSIFWTILLLLGVGAIQQVVYGQNHSLDNKQYKVISLDGLNMRMNPHIESVILHALPFGEQVELLEAEGFGSLQLPSRTLHHADLTSSVAFNGDWWKVKYREQEGFVFSGFLRPANDWNSGANFPGINMDFHLLFTGYNCFNNVPPHNRFHWYGLYRVEKNAYEFRVVEPRFFFRYEDLGSQIITILEDQELLFIIGSLKPFKQLASDQLLVETAPKPPVQDWLDHHFPQSLQLENGTPEVPWEARLFVQRGEKRQCLNPEASLVDAPRRILWNGDLDGDQQDDYVIQYGEKWSHTVLYLSTVAADGEIVRPVAVYYSGYCC